MKLTSDQIGQLLLEKITGTIQPEDDLLIEQLLEEDEHTLQRWHLLRQQLAMAEVKGFDTEADVDAGWASLKRGMIQKRKHGILWYQRLSAAAVLAMVISGFYFWSHSNSYTPSALPALAFADEDRISLRNERGAIIYLNPDSTAAYQQGNARFRNVKSALTYYALDEATSQWHHLSVPRVLNYKITLPDGTEVSMNSRTTLRFPDTFTGSTREVYLDGEAFFHVAKNAARPFIVHARNTRIRVLGTSFNLNTYDSSVVKTSLLEGSVLAVANGKKVELRPGFQASNKEDGNDFTVGSFDTSEVLSWMKGVYHFRNASLGELSAVLSRWYKIKVVFENPLLQRKTFSGEISKDQPVELFLDNLKISNGVNLRFDGGTVIFQ